MHRISGEISCCETRCAKSINLPRAILTGKAAKAGTQVVIPYREEDEKRHLKVTGDLGQIVSMVQIFHLTLDAKFQ